MLTKSDKKFIIDAVSSSVNSAITENNKILIKEIMDLFNATNERIDQNNERIDKVLSQLKSHNEILSNHERRIEKVEEKTFSSN